MKITIYELLGLIKDGKAPKKIKYMGNIYVYNQKDKRYHNVNPKRLDLSSKFGDFNFNYLDDEVEILDEEDDFIDVEEFCTSYSLDYIDYRDIEVLKEYLNKDLQNIFDTLDKLIKNQKKIINKLKEEGE